MKFTFYIYAKQLGALGVRDVYKATIEAETRDQAELKLYDTYEHIRIMGVE